MKTVLGRDRLTRAPAYDDSGRGDVLPIYAVNRLVVPVMCLPTLLVMLCRTIALLTQPRVIGCHRRNFFPALELAVLVQQNVKLPAGISGGLVMEAS